MLKCNTAPKTSIDTKQEESLPSPHSFSKHMEIIVGPETHNHNSHCASRGSIPALHTLTERSKYWNANLHTQRQDLRSQRSHNKQHYQLEQGSPDQVSSHRTCRSSSAWERLVSEAALLYLK